MGKLMTKAANVVRELLRSREAKVEEWAKQHARFLEVGAKDAEELAVARARRDAWREPEAALERLEQEVRGRSLDMQRELSALDVWLKDNPPRELVAFMRWTDRVAQGLGRRNRGPTRTTMNAYTDEARIESLDDH